MLGLPISLYLCDLLPEEKLRFHQLRLSARYSCEEEVQEAD